MNLLGNGDFVEDWASDQRHTVYVYGPDGRYVASQEDGSVFVPPKWDVWYKHGLPAGGLPWDPDNDTGYAAPEVRDARATDPDRFVTGGQATLFFTFSRIHEGGYRQRVSVEVGRTYRLTGYAHAWSNAWGTANTDNPSWSEGVGIGPTFILEGETDDQAQRNFTFYLGIDPTGGDDPYASTVVWGQGAHSYNGHHELPTVEVEAVADHITVFLKSTVLWRYKHNDAYWDAIGLEKVSVTPPPPPLPWYLGSRIGVHTIWSDQVVSHAQALVNGGTYFKVVKGVDDLGYLEQVKQVSPSTVTVARLTHPHEGAGEVNEPDTDLRAYAESIMLPIFQRLELAPELRDAVDYWEPVNEPLGGGIPSEVYGRLAVLMRHCMNIARDNGLKLALFAFNAGTPEWADMVAIVETGVFAQAKAEGHILSVHEGVFGDQDVREGYGDQIPGAPVVDGAGSLCFRYRYLYRLLEQRNEVIPLFVSEFYAGGGYDPADQDDIMQRFAWYDLGTVSDWYHWGFAPFTLGPTPAWKDHDYGPFYNAVVAYMISVKSRQNAQPPDTPSPPLHPRVQYTRCYVLLPPETPLTWAVAAVEAVWETTGYTLGRSADDAGNCADLETRRVIALNPDAWGPGEGLGLREFYETHYAGVDVRQVLAQSPEELAQSLKRPFEDLPPLGYYPTAGPVPITPRGLVGLHLQADLPNQDPSWRHFVSRGPACCAILFQAERCAEVKALSGGQTVTCWRHWISDQDELELLALPTTTAVSRYLSWAMPTLEQHAASIDYFLSINEKYDRGNPALTDAAAAFDAEMCRQLAATGLPIRPGVLAAPVSNPGIEQLDVILPVVEECCAKEGAIFYHAYWMVVRGQSRIAQNWDIHTGLFLTQFEPEFARRGLRPNYFAGELGAVGSLDGVQWESDQGWRHPNVYGGDWSRYEADWRYLNTRLLEWEQQHGAGRIIGGVPFTTGRTGAWDSYELDGPDLELLRKAVYPMNV